MKGPDFVLGDEDTGEIVKIHQTEYLSPVCYIICKLYIIKSEK